MGAPLHEQLESFRRRWMFAGVGGALGWGCAGALVALLVVAWLDLLVELPGSVRAVAAYLAAVGGVAVVAGMVVRAIRRSDMLSLARRVDALAGARGQVLSGADLAIEAGPTGLPAGGSSDRSVVTAGLAAVAVQRAGELAQRVAGHEAVPAKMVWRPYAGLGAMLLVVGLVALISPRLVATQWNRLVDPFGDHPPFSRVVLAVEPGDTQVIYGTGVEIHASAEGGAIDRMVLVLRFDGEPEQSLPMFPEQDGRWRATITNVTDPGRYLVTGGGTRSRQHQIGVITVPHLEQVTFRVIPPAYTNGPAYEGPLPQGGLAGLPGTTVQVRAKSNRPLSGGTMRFVEMGVDRPTVEPWVLGPGASGVSEQSNEVIGEFVMERSGRLEISVRDVAGQQSQDLFTAPVTVLADERPFVRVVEPKPHSLATPDVTLQVVALAEDDYGVSRVQLFRALNESRARATDLEVPVPAVRRHAAAMPLALSDYGLRPGDVVKLYARVEDTDPAGPKGSESPIVTVQIISQADLERLLLAREGMEVLQTKYAQAMRRLEALDRLIEELQQELAAVDPQSELAEARREQLRALAERMKQEAAEVAKAAEHQLPFDIDAALSDHLKELAKSMQEGAAAAEQLAGQPGLSVARAGEGLQELRERLSARRRQFEQDTIEPLEHLAAVMPLLEAEARYIELYEQQRELEQRMASLQGERGGDPSTHGRMRDLEDEQRQLRQELRVLLDDIENHAQRLPDREVFEDLRRTAQAFARAVRDSEAAAEMNKAETALAEFAGSPAQVAAQRAADILESFIAQCRGMGQDGEAGLCLRFQPTLAGGLGDTIEQMLAGLGMGSGMMGAGSGTGGYSMRRQTLQNVGIYGSLPTHSAASTAQGGSADRGFGTDGRGGGDDADDPDVVGAWGELRASGEAMTDVPVRYRRRVGEYFRRVADELE